MSLQQIKIFIAGICSLILTMGIARFAYTPLLQIMQDANLLNDAMGGWLAASNYFGYLTGTIIAASINNLVLKDKLYRVSLIIAVVSTIAMAWTENWIIWSLWRYLAGLTAAGGLLLGSGLIMNWLVRHGYQMNMGIHFGGVGLGIVLTAIAVELMLPVYDWATQWEIFAVIGLVLAFPAWCWLPKPDGYDVTKSGKQLVDQLPDAKWLRLLSISYFFVGIAYVIYATFLVVIVNNREELIGYGNWAWFLVGLIMIPCSYIWEKIANHVGDFIAFLMAYILMTISIAILIFDVPLALIVLSAILYGGSMMGIVSMMLTLVGKLAPTRPAKLMGKISIYYAVAQIIGPAFAGYTAEVYGNYSMVMLCSTIVMLIGIVLLIRLKIANTNLL
ncbi:MAG: YbfB/YjiJ family MFS transporter [Pseudomonadota bacterium]